MLQNIYKIACYINKKLLHLSSTFKIFLDYGFKLLITNNS